MNIEEWGEIPEFTPKKCFEVYKDGGREALKKIFCTYNNDPNMNLIMEEIVDCMVYAFTGQMSTNEFIEKMDYLNGKFYDAICDMSLDYFNEGKIDGKEMSDILNELRKKKAEMDDI